jgi:hypothetical protein
MAPLKVLGAVLAAGWLAAGCGGGLNPEAMQPSEVPLAATLSSAQFSLYAATMPTSDTAEPMDVSRLNPPTSETEEPQARP